MEDYNTQAANNMLDEQDKYQSQLERYDLDCDTKLEKVVKLYSIKKITLDDLLEYLPEGTNIDGKKMGDILDLIIDDIDEKHLDELIGNVVEENELAESDDYEDEEDR